MNEETKKPQEEQVKKEVKETKAPEQKPVSKEKKEPEPKPEEEKAKPAGKVPPVAAEQKKEAGAKKRKKINCLTLEELEKKIQEVQEKMGGLTSTYARQLLKRKEQLSEEKEKTIKPGESNATNS